ncbi:hypothetical protein [Paenibacillus sp. FSL P2-0136]|uniref:hypothetical protein n=1 Tax=Paenibacillus sp. FSL P2-0136 TaxID=2975317 RepID=UPI0030D7D048
MSQWIKRLFPCYRANEREVLQASGRITVSIRRYKDTSKEIQEEIRNNGFAEFLIYDRGADNGGTDIVLLIAYGISFVCALLLMAALFLYFRKRFRVRAGSLFMLAIFLFLGAYTVKMAIAFWIRVSNISGGDAVNTTLKSMSWAVAQTGTTLGLVKGRRTAMLTLEQIELKS